MPGYVIDGTPIAVDFWKPTKVPQVRLFFLTHFHTDHTEGLTSSWRLPIYTSPITAQLLIKKFKLPASVVRELEVGQSYLIPLSEGSNTSTITVSILDANHIPGSVMFLFQGYFGNILYCGDMRWYPELLEDPVLRDVVQHKALDILYLDNTYSAPFCQFPSREEAKQQIFEIIDAYPDHEIKIGINNIGRESLLEAIAQRYGERILVSPEKYEQLELLGRNDVFTTDPKLSRIHTVPVKQIQVATHEKWNAIHQTISIIPSALFVGWKSGPFTSQASNGIHVVPYSDHSSYAELVEMVSRLAPHQILPIVKYWSKSGWWADLSAPDQDQKADMTVYRHLLSVPPPAPVVIPEDVIKVMNTRAPMFFQFQARRCVLRRGLSPRRSRSQGVMFSPPRSQSSISISDMRSRTPSGTPSSLSTLDGCRYDLTSHLESPRSPCKFQVLSPKQTKSNDSPRSLSRSNIPSPRRGSSKESPSPIKHGVKRALYGITESKKCRPDGVRNESQDSHVLDEGVEKRQENTTVPSDPCENPAVAAEQTRPPSQASCIRDCEGDTNHAVDQQQQQQQSEPAIVPPIIDLSEDEQTIEVNTNLEKKSKSHDKSMKTNDLLKELNNFLEYRNEIMSSVSMYSLEEDLCVMAQDADFILESLSCLTSSM